MKLNEWFQKYPKKRKCKFAKKIGITSNTLQTVLKEMHDIRLSTACAIVELTKGEVGFDDLNFYSKKKTAKTMVTEKYRQLELPVFQNLRKEI